MQANFRKRSRIPQRADGSPAVVPSQPLPNAPRPAPSMPEKPVPQHLDALIRQMHQAAKISGIEQNDPLAPVLEAIIGFMKHIDNKALEQEYIVQAYVSEATNLLKLTQVTSRMIAERYQKSIEERGARTIEIISAKIAESADRALARRVRVFDRNAAFVAVLMLVSSTLGGYFYGRWQGKRIADASIGITEINLQSAFNHGPQAANTWLQLMRWNNPRSALSYCHGSSVFIQNGRRACNVPLWIAPPLPAPPQATG